MGRAVFFFPFAYFHNQAYSCLNFSKSATLAVKCSHLRTSTIRSFTVKVCRERKL